MRDTNLQGILPKEDFNVYAVWGVMQAINLCLTHLHSERPKEA